MWVCVLVTVVVYAPILWLVTRHSPYYYLHGASAVARGLFSFWNTALYMYGAVLTQGKLEVTAFCITIGVHV